MGRATDRLCVEMRKVTVHKYYWVAVETDEYELPLFVADSARELAEKFDTTKHNIECNVDRGDNGRCSGRKFMKIPRKDMEE